MKKLLSMILTLTLVFSFSTTAFAADPAGKDGSITIENAYIGETYTLYKMFNVVSYMDADTSAEGWNGYVYEIMPEWEAFLASDAAKVTVGDGESAEEVLPFLIDDEKKVTLNPKAESLLDSEWAEFAKAALAYAKVAANNIPVAESHTIEGTIVPGAENTVKYTFTGLDYGYYLIDTTMGLLCALNTTDPSITIKDKNTPPTISKEVQEDSTSAWGGSNDADINQKVYYKTKIDAKTGAYGYVVHDKMTAGLTFNDDVTVELVKDGADLDEDTVAGEEKDDADVVDPANYKVAVTPGCDWPVVAESATAEKCTFTVTFTDEFLATLKNGDTLWVYYSATLNKNAVVDVAELNDTYLKYGNNSVTRISETETVTHEFDMAKVDGETKAVITGAEFKLYKIDSEGEYVEFSLVETVADSGVYRPAAADETGVVIKVGEATIVGLDKDVYYLKETKQPDGYNKVKEYIEVDLSEGSAKDTYEYVDETAEGGKDKAAVVVENNKGVELPSTGGMGTTMFYIVGGLMTVGALVVLIARKRMGETE